MRYQLHVPRWLQLINCGVLLALGTQALIHHQTSVIVGLTVLSVMWCMIAHGGAQSVVKKKQPPIVHPRTVKTEVLVTRTARVHPQSVDVEEVER